MYRKQLIPCKAIKNDSWKKLLLIAIYDIFVFRYVEAKSAGWCMKVSRIFRTTLTSHFHRHFYLITNHKFGYLVISLIIF